MSRDKGFTDLSLSYDVSYSGPIDTRQRVSDITDLYEIDTWQSHDTQCTAYNGMIVTVSTTTSFNGIYCLIDVDNLDKESSWLRLDNTSSGGNTGLNIVVLKAGDNLPSEGVPGTLYFKPEAATAGISNIYYEYMFIDGEYEQIGFNPGDIQIDVSTLVTRTEFEDLALTVESFSESINANSNAITGLTTNVETNAGEIHNIKAQITGNLLIAGDREKLDALELDGDNITVSGKVDASNINGMDTWIRSNRNMVAGLLSDTHEATINKHSSILANIVAEAGEDDYRLKLSKLVQDDEDLEIILEAYKN